MIELEEIQGQLLIDGYSLDFCSGKIDKFILRLFPISSLSNQEIKTNQLYQLGLSNYPDDRVSKVEVLELSARQIIDRLETFGYTIDRSKNEFERARTKILSTQFSDINGDSDFKYPDFPDQAAFETPRKSREYFVTLDFETFLKACQVIIQQKRRRILKVIDGKNKSIIPEDISNPIERYLVCNGLGSAMFDDKISYIRLLIDKINPDSKVQYLFDGFPIKNMSDISKVYSYYFDPKELSTKYGLQTLIITEGITDTKYLNFALSRCFPHLVDLFYFMDFTINGGNADSVVKVTLSLASSGIPNNIVALFDNDFEGNRAKRELETRLFPLPSNVYILSYPDIEIAMNYPILKSGNAIEYANVNGRGCAIEMFLGEDILSEDSKLIPLTENQNGQFSFRSKNKTIIQKKFEKKIDNGICESDLFGLNKIISTILEKLKKK
ncbi:MAG: hypothetical protein KFKLKKLM_01712 [Flavobacteriales bacterium]|nr:hypothetical protein [Flavobacteriales bacterium]